MDRVKRRGSTGRLIRNICLALVLLIVMPYCLHALETVGLGSLANTDHLVRGVAAHWHHHLDVRFRFSAPIARNCAVNQFAIPFTGPFMANCLGAAVPLL